MYYLKCLFFVFFISFKLHAQSDNLNHEKYKIYRERLQEEFMLYSGDNMQGSNIPASIIDRQKKQIRWGDATINLSFYIATLATEYRLRKENNEDYSNSFNDLYYAMQALERLDMSAEAFYDSSIYLSQPNGFFIRDDVPVNLNGKLQSKHKANEALRVKSDYTSHDSRNNEMSQDQVWHLLLSLTLVEALVDDSTKVRINTSSGIRKVEMAEWARLFAYRLIKSMQTEYCLYLWQKRILCSKFWMVSNPVTGKKVKRGAWPTMLEYGFAQAGNKITKKQYGNLHWGDSKKAKVWFNIIAGLQRFQSLSKTGEWSSFYHAAALATAGDIWSSKKLIRLFNHHHRLLFIKSPQYEHLALISYLLYGGSNKLMMNEKQFYLNLLNKASFTGPFNFANPSIKNYVPEWSSVNRLVWPERLDDNMPLFLKGEYNGLDYLLLHSLYYLVYDFTSLKDDK